MFLGIIIQELKQWEFDHQVCDSITALQSSYEHKGNDELLRIS